MTRNRANGSAGRMRRFRERRRAGVVCMASVPVYAFDVAVLVKDNRLAREHHKNREKIAEAVEAVLDDFAEDRLGSRNSSPQDKPEAVGAACGTVNWVG